MKWDKCNKKNPAHNSKATSLGKSGVNEQGMLKSERFFFLCVHPKIFIIRLLLDIYLYVKKSKLLLVVLVDGMEVFA